jgi:hypothetical protein
MHVHFDYVEADVLPDVLAATLARKLPAVLCSLLTWAGKDLHKAHTAFIKPLWRLCIGFRHAD